MIKFILLASWGLVIIYVVSRVSGPKFKSTQEAITRNKKT